jgi:hypothetical protein
MRAVTGVGLFTFRTRRVEKGGFEAGSGAFRTRRVETAIAEAAEVWITEDWPFQRPRFGLPGHQQPYQIALQ